MVGTKFYLENMSNDKLIDEVVCLENFKSDINSKFLELSDCFNDFDSTHKMVNSNLSILRS